jgi:hypothetical protein
MIMRASCEVLRLQITRNCLFDCDLPFVDLFNKLQPRDLINPYLSLSYSK